MNKEIAPLLSNEDKLHAPVLACGMSPQLIGILLLIFCQILTGANAVLTRVGVDYIDPFLFSAIRPAVASVCLLIIGRVFEGFLIFDFENNAKALSAMITPDVISSLLS
jgi:drug/metabolite transporter (DMT)-like permease